MEDKTDILVIIPAYNEAKNISMVISGIKDIFPQIDIVVINDASTDNTQKCSQDAGAKVISLPFNLGYGAALQTGFKFALEAGYEYIIQIDADGQHNPKDILKILEPVLKGETDLSIGSRFLGGNEYQTSFARRLGISFFRVIVSFFVGKKITDPTSGFQALNKKVVSFFVGDRYPVDFPDADVLIMLHRAGFRIAERPVQMNPSASKKSMHSGLKPVYYIFKMLLSIFVTLLRKD